MSKVIKKKCVDCAVLKRASSSRAWSVATTEYVSSLKGAARRLLRVTEIFQRLFAVKCLMSKPDTKAEARRRCTRS